jgi:hypothetical protein
VGLAINIYQQANQSTVDHCGVIIEDNIGRPFIYELTSSGVTVTPYVQRITESLSDHIVLVPLKKKNVNEITFRQQLFQYALAQKKTSPPLSEALELYKGAVREYLTKPEEVARSPSVDFVMKALSEAGVSLREEEVKQVTCDEILEGKLQPREEEEETAAAAGETGAETGTETDKGKWKYQFGERIILRSMS